MTARAGFVGADDSWLPGGTQEFFRLCGKGGWIGDTLRLFLIGVFGAIGTLARYGLQGLVQIKIGSTFPYGTLLINLTGCFFSGIDRADFAKPRDRPAGMAYGHRGWIFWRLHHFFQFWMGSGENAGGGRVVVGDGVCGGQCGVWVAAFGGGDPASEPVLGACDDAPEI